MYAGTWSRCYLVEWRAPATVDLEVHDPSHHVVSSVIRGTPIHGSVTIRGEYPNTTGSVFFRSYSDASCSSGEEAASLKKLEDGSLDRSDFERTTTSGSVRSFKVYYLPSPDSDYLLSQSPCVAVTILAAPTTAPPTSVPPGATATPGATPEPGASAAPTSGPAVTEEPGASGPPTSGSPGSASPTAGSAGTGAPTSGAPNGATPGPGQTSGPAAVDPSAASGGFDWILLLVALVIALAAFGAFLLGRRRSAAP